MQARSHRLTTEAEVQFNDAAVATTDANVVMCSGGAAAKIAISDLCPISIYEVIVDDTEGTETIQATWQKIYNDFAAGKRCYVSYDSALSPIWCVVQYSFDGNTEFVVLTSMGHYSAQAADQYPFYDYGDE